MVLLSKLHELSFYSLAEAKAHFSKVVDDCEKADIIITKNGLPKAVMMDYDKYVLLSRFLERVYDLYLMDAGDEAMDVQIKDLIVQVDDD
ncbi:MULTISPECIES: type II toxin-antitoxin system Phd/YefM family antitoxin [unclassified Mesotoga]|uniref:type II toxin-antitoxin system Phd/YefM family antitoxin n=1 Tax=unclassified Mesotoga TaxID=1184398 RepID=UPI0025EB47F7|nr:type II toxin-antitoxin system Phd/YefM family antitoxin [Mesotoga sp. UBA5825]